jgi:hypothetical protein
MIEDFLFLRVLCSVFYCVTYHRVHLDVKERLQVTALDLEQPTGSYDRFTVFRIKTLYRDLICTVYD